MERIGLRDISVILTVSLIGALLLPVISSLAARLAAGYMEKVNVIQGAICQNFIPYFICGIAIGTVMPPILRVKTFLRSIAPICVILVTYGLFLFLGPTSYPVGASSVQDTILMFSWLIFLISSVGGVYVGFYISKERKTYLNE